MAAAGVLSLAVALSFASATDAEAQGKAKAKGKPVVITKACVYSTLLCPAVVMAPNGERYDISGLKRPNANPVNVIGFTRPDGVGCGTRVQPGRVTAAKGVCILPLRLF
ncbi:MAG: hypothetical protein K2P86_03780 [Xanthobacteraceae bacterium]|nr:hypothetical protein [Xanthobacteraceae bacterium]